MTDWTFDRTQDLITLWNDGLKAGEIARALGVSRNAVIGKAHRLGLDTRDGSPRKPVPAYKRKPRKMRTDKRPSCLPSLAISILDIRRGQCRYSTHDVAGEHVFCGHETDDGSPYCEAHRFDCTKVTV